MMRINRPNFHIHMPLWSSRASTFYSTHMCTLLLYSSALILPQLYNTTPTYYKINHSETLPAALIMINYPQLHTPQPPQNHHSPAPAFQPNKPACKPCCLPCMPSHPRLPPHSPPATSSELMCSFAPDSRGNTLLPSA